MQHSQGEPSAKYVARLGAPPHAATCRHMFQVSAQRSLSTASRLSFAKRKKLKRAPSATSYADQLALSSGYIRAAQFALYKSK